MRDHHPNGTAGASPGALVRPPGAWVADALCGQSDPEAWYADDRTSQDAALATCARCTVLPECRTWALGTGERFGIWGGMTAKERRDWRRTHPAEQAA